MIKRSSFAHYIVKLNLQLPTPVSRFVLLCVLNINFSLYPAIIMRAKYTWRFWVQIQAQIHNLTFLTSAEVIVHR